jgi:hypothetical protein
MHCPCLVWKSPAQRTGIELNNRGAVPSEQE